MKTLISVVIVNWNGIKWLDKCLTSLVSQTMKNLEIIVVDNNSSDKSTEFIRNNFNSVRIIENKQNLGFAYGNNIGIKNSNGEYVMLINSDTWVERDFVEKIYASYLKNKCDVLGPAETQYKSPKYTEYTYTIDLLGYPVMQKKDKGKLFFIKGSCLFFKKSIYEESKGFDSDFFMYFEECDWFWRLHLLKKRIYQDNSIFIYHDGVGMKIHKNPYPYFLWRNQNTLQMLLKNYSSISLLFILPVYLLQNTIEFFVFLIIMKPKLALSYLQGWHFNLKKLKKTLRKRKWIQDRRVVSDLEIIKLMYTGSGKLKHISG